MAARLLPILTAFIALFLPIAKAEPSAPAPTAVASVSETLDVTPARYPNADTVVLDQTRRVIVQADGAYVGTSTFRRKALTEKGRRALLTYTTGFNTAYSTIKATELRIVKPDGRVVTLDAGKQSAVQQDPSSAGMNIYDPRDKRLVVAIPGVEIGDAVEVTTVETATKSPMPGCFSDIVLLEDNEPVLHSHYRIVTPKSLPLASITFKGGDDAGVKRSTEEKDGQIVYTWEAGETSQIIPEPGMPDLSLCVRRLLVSTVPDWPTISKWYWSVSEPHYQITTDIRKQAEEITRGLTDREERIRAIFRFVSQEIRYMGVIPESETEAPGFEPHDVDLTFGKRYGVCRDKAALLAVMFRAAGIEAYPVLINAGSKVDDAAPGLRFNHAITAIKEPDNTFRLVDSTNESTKDPFPAYLHNCSYIIAKPDGDTLHVAPLPDVEGQMLSAQTKLAVQKDGSVVGDSTIDFSGINDTSYRGKFASSKLDDIRRFFQTVTAGVIPGATIESVKIEPENMKDTEKPLRVHLLYRAPDFLTAQNGTALLRTPFISQTLGMAARQLTGATTLDKRRFPIRFGILAGLRERVTIALPETVSDTLALPKDCQLDDANLSYTRSYRREGKTLTCDFDLRMRRLDVPAEDYGALRNDLREMSRAGKRAALLSAATDTKPDTHVFSRKVTANVLDEHTLATRVEVRQKVLTYAGKKDNAEFKLYWNTSSPEPQLERAVVTDAKGVEHTVGPNEINILDAGWVAAAPRYKPSRTKVISLPSVEEGSVIDYAYTTMRRDLAGITWESLFTSNDLVDADEVEVILPADLKYYLTDRAGATIRTEGDKVHITVKRRELPTPREASIAPGRTWAPWLALTTFRDEAAAAAALRERLADKALPEESIRTKATELTAGVTDETARITALRNFVAISVRNAGPGLTEIPLSELSGAMRTLTDRYGNAADRQLLFTALLKAAGYDATSALYATNELDVATRGSGDPFDLGLYSTLGTRLRLQSGDIVDFTQLNQYAALNASAPAGSLVLPLDTGAPDTVHSAPEISTWNYSIALSEAGDAKFSYASAVTGNGANGLRKWMAEVTPEDRAREFQRMISGISRDAKAEGDLRTAVDDVGRMAYDASIADFAVVEDKYAYFDLPSGAGEVFYGANEFTRRLPYAVGRKSEQHATWTVTLPRGWKLAGESTSLDWEAPCGVGRVSVSVTEKPSADGGRTLVWKRDVSLRAGVVPEESYPALVELNRRMKSPDLWRVLLERDAAVKGP
jgi:hypothetical protein